MFDLIRVRAGFSNLNIKAGKTVLQFELDAKCLNDIPALVHFTNKPVNLEISTDQEVLFIHEDTGEIADEPLFDADEEGEQETEEQPDAEEAEGGEPEGEE